LKYSFHCVGEFVLFKCLKAYLSFYGKIRILFSLNLHNFRYTVSFDNLIFACGTVLKLIMVVYCMFVMCTQSVCRKVLQYCLLMYDMNVILKISCWIVLYLEAISQNMDLWNQINWIELYKCMSYKIIPYYGILWKLNQFTFSLNLLSKSVIYISPTGFSSPPPPRTTEWHQLISGIGIFLQTSIDTANYDWHLCMILLRISSIKTT
jgi:hypothetical protein